MNSNIVFKKLGDKNSLIFTADVSGNDVTFGFVEGPSEPARIVSTSQSACQTVMDTLNNLNIPPMSITPANIEQILVDNKLMQLH